MTLYNFPCFISSFKKKHCNKSMEENSLPFLLLHYSHNFFSSIREKKQRKHKIIFMYYVLWRHWEEKVLLKSSFPLFKKENNTQGKQMCGTYQWFPFRWKIIYLDFIWRITWEFRGDFWAIEAEFQLEDFLFQGWT